MLADAEHRPAVAAAAVTSQSVIAAVAAHVASARADLAAAGAGRRLWTERLVVRNRLVDFINLTAHGATDAEVAALKPVEALVDELERLIDGAETDDAFWAKAGLDLRRVGEGFEISPTFGASVDALLGSEHAADNSTWRAAVDNWKALVAKREAINSDEDEDAYEAAESDADDAFEVVMNTRAPDLASATEKARLIINELHGSPYPEGHADNPAWLSHMMNEGWSEHALASLYQDLACLSGTPGTLGFAIPDTFDAVAWIAETAVGLNARFRWVTTDTREPDHLSFEGVGGHQAQAAFDGLAPWRQSAVKSYLSTQAYRLERERNNRPAEWIVPTDVANMIRTFAEMAAWKAEQEDADARADLRRRLRENMRRDVGLPVGVPDFDPAAFVAAAYDRGCCFKIENPAFGPEILRRPVDESEETRAITLLFCQLDGDQVDALCAYLIERNAWAAEWVKQVERDSGCFVSFQSAGIGFGVGPDHDGKIEVASAALNALSDAERADLKSYCQQRAREGEGSSRMSS